MNADPTSHQLGFHVGEYRFEGIRTQYPAYLAIDGTQQPAHCKTKGLAAAWAVASSGKSSP